MRIAADASKDQCPSALFRMTRLMYNGLKRFSLEQLPMMMGHRIPQQSQTVPIDSFDST